VVEVDPSLKLFGMGMILLGMFLQGGQVVAEEYLMKDVDCPELMVVGMEGLWGIIFMFGAIFPVLGHISGSDVGGVAENLSNDWAMVWNSTTLQLAICVYLFSVMTYNTAGMFVTSSLSAVHNTMIEATRTAVIWSLDLLIHQFLPSSPYGETWNSWSYLQLVGFAVLLLGQATYSEVITWGVPVHQPVNKMKFLSPVRDPGGSPLLASADAPRGKVADLDIGA